MIRRIRKDVLPIAMPDMAAAEMGEGGSRGWRGGGGVVVWGVGDVVVEDVIGIVEVWNDVDVDVDVDVSVERGTDVVGKPVPVGSAMGVEDERGRGRGGTSGFTGAGSFPVLPAWSGIDWRTWKAAVWAGAGAADAGV